MKVRVKRGCPLSLILFNIDINPVMVEVSRAGVIPFLFEIPLQVLTYADDIALISNIEEYFEVLIEKSNEVAEFCGIKPG